MGINSPPCNPAAVSASVGTFPDLRYSPRIQTLEAFEAVVIDGELTSGGMVSFDSSLEDADADAIRQYVIAQAHIALEAQGR